MRSRFTARQPSRPLARCRTQMQAEAMRRLLVLAACLIGVPAAVTARAPGPAALTFTHYNHAAPHASESVWVAAADGSDASKVAADGYGGQLSADGTWLIYHTGAGPRTPLVLRNLLTGAQRRLDGDAAQWAPSGSGFALARGQKLALVDAATGRRTRLLNARFSAFDFTPRRDVDRRRALERPLAHTDAQRHLPPAPRRPSPRPAHLRRPQRRAGRQPCWNRVRPLPEGGPRAGGVDDAERRRPPERHLPLLPAPRRPGARRPAARLPGCGRLDARRPPRSLPGHVGGLQQFRGRPPHEPVPVPPRVHRGCRSRPERGRPLRSPERRAVPRRTRSLPALQRPVRGWAAHPREVERARRALAPLGVVA